MQAVAYRDIGNFGKPGRDGKRETKIADDHVRLGALDETEVCGDASFCSSVEKWCATLQSA